MSKLHCHHPFFNGPLVAILRFNSKSAQELTSKHIKSRKPTENENMISHKLLASLALLYSYEVINRRCEKTLVKRNFPCVCMCHLLYRLVSKRKPTKFCKNTVNVHCFCTGIVRPSMVVV